MKENNTNYHTHMPHAMRSSSPRTTNGAQCNDTMVVRSCKKHNCGVLFRVAPNYRGHLYYCEKHRNRASPVENSASPVENSASPVENSASRDETSASRDETSASRDENNTYPDEMDLLLMEIDAARAEAENSEDNFQLLSKEIDATSADPIGIVEGWVLNLRTGIQH